MCWRPFYRFSDFGMKKGSMAFGWMYSMHTVKILPSEIILDVKTHWDSLVGCFMDTSGKNTSMIEIDPNCWQCLKYFVSWQMSSMRF